MPEVKVTTVPSSRAASTALIPALFVVLCTMLSVNAGSAQDIVRPLDRAERAVEALDYTRARTELEALISNPSSLTIADLARAHLLLGIVDYSENNIQNARSRFVSALQLDPSIKPDPRTVSPKIVSFFGSLQAEAVVRSDADIRYVTIVDNRPAAALRSMVLPGWGQFYKGERTKGFVASTAWVGTSGATVASAIAERRARNLYLDETDPNQVAARFDTWNSRQKMRKTFLASMAVVWLAAYVDALASPGDTRIAPSRLSVVPGQELGVGVAWRFGENRQH